MTVSEPGQIGYTKVARWILPGKRPSVTFASLLPEAEVGQPKILFPLCTKGLIEGS